MIISVNIPDKTLYVGETPMRLEDSLRDASIEDSVLELRYASRRKDGDSILGTEGDKLRDICGDNIFDTMRMDGERTSDHEYTIAIYGEDVTPRIIG